MRDPGFYDDIPEAEYHADPDSLSVSGAKVLLKAPALYRWQQDNPAPHRDVFDFGTAAHALILGAGSPLEVIHHDDWRGKAAREERDAARAEGKTPILWGDYDVVCAMAEAIKAHPLASRLLTDGKPEVSAFALDEETGVMRRGRFDWLGDTILSDYKTTRSSEPSAFARDAASFGYHMQAAWYLDLAADLGHPAQAFALIAQEKTAPYLVSVVEFDDRAIARGRELNARALRMFRDCTESGVWPGYQQPNAFTTVALPRWAFYDDEETVA